MKIVLLTSLNPSKSEFARPYSSTSGISNKIGVIVSCLFLIFILYVTFKVWRSLRNDKK